MDDDSAGEPIPGSTGEPSGYYGNGLTLSAGNTLSFQLGNCRFSHLGTAVRYWSDDDYYQSSSIKLFNAQFCNCYMGMNTSGVYVDFQNCLFAGDEMVLFCADTFGTAENVTVAQCNWFGFPNDGGGSSLYVTNSMIVALGRQPNDYGDSDDALDYETNTTVTLSSDSGVFASAANANYYLATSSPYRNAGTTAIDPDLLVGLQAMTTYAPQDGSLLDTGTPDLGYHYPVNEDSNNNGIPDWWERKYFGSFDQSGTNDFDGDGVSNLDEYSGVTDPNKIRFSIGSTNDYVNHTNVTVQLEIIAGVPSYYAIFVNHATTTNWLSFSTTNLYVNLGTTDGTYTVFVGLRGRPADAQQTWAEYEFFVDRIAPIITVTNPILSGSTGTVIKPYLQAQGFVNEELSYYSCDVSNAVGVVTNLNVSIIDQFFDTNRFDFTTNYFQCYDIPLTNGLNRLGLHVTDRAGNVTTTNFDVTLDYTSATNPPVVKLIWPQDGMRVSGTNCTVRGSMSDETGTIEAEIINGNGTTNELTGLVERNHLFWFENVPLDGTNQVNLKATDAAGNVTTTNFIVKPGTLGLTISSTPDGDDLWKPTGNVSGTVSDSSATVTVNGIPATVDAGVNGNGSYNWSASNVPNYGQGTATFDVNASSAGGQAAASTAVEKAPKWVYSLHTVNETDIADYGPYMNWNSSWIKTYSETVEVGADGNYTNKYRAYGLLQNNEVLDGFPGNWTELYAWSNNDPDGQVDVNGSIGTNHADSIEESESWKPMSVPQNDFAYSGPPASYVVQYYAKDVKCRLDTSLGYREIALGAATKVKLYTGGKGLVHRQNLFGIQASAQAYKKLSDFQLAGFATYAQGWLPSTPINPTTLEVAGKHPGTDGKVWTTFPDNTSQDITVKAPGVKHFNANADPQKYRSYISLVTATTNANLDTDVPEICVGQLATFTLAWDPLTPPYVNMVGRWRLPGKFVNQPTNYSSTCLTYVRNDALLENTNVTSCWYQNKPGGHVTIGMNLLFQNGQTASIAANGDFTVYRPSISDFFDQPPSFPTNVVENGIAYLQLGDILSHGDMKFDVSVFSIFDGEAGVVQLINRAASTGSLRDFSTDGEFWLDTSYPYFSRTTRNPPDYIEYVIPISDGPSQQEIHNSFITDTTTVVDKFVNYIVFCPNGGGNIYVTLGIVQGANNVSWSWSGSSTWTSSDGWSVPAGSITRPTWPNSSDDFPTWPETWHNQ